MRSQSSQPEWGRSVGNQNPPRRLLLPEEMVALGEDLKAQKRFWSHVEKKDKNQCWPWMSALSQKGYGVFNYRQKTMKSHRISYFLSFGTLIDGLLVCHRCDNPPCCNPNHLFLGTAMENQRDSILKGRSRKAIGEYASSAKLKEDQVVEIRCLHSVGNTSFKKLSTIFGVARSTVEKIVKRKTWRHIPKIEQK